VCVVRAVFFLFFFNATATTEIYTLSLHALFRSPSGAPDFTSGIHRSSCSPVICVSLFHVSVLSFEF